MSAEETLRVSNESQVAFGFCGLLGVVGAIMVPYAVAVSPELDETAWLPCVVFELLFLGWMVFCIHRLTTRVRITADTITCSSLFRSRTVRKADITAVRMKARGVQVVGRNGRLYIPNAIPRYSETVANLRQQYRPEPSEVDSPSGDLIAAYTALRIFKWALEAHLAIGIVLIAAVGLALVFPCISDDLYGRLIQSVEVWAFAFGPILFVGFLLLGRAKKPLSGANR